MGRAGFLLRTVAALIDGIFLTIILMLIIALGVLLAPKFNFNLSNLDNLEKQILRGSLPVEAVIIAAFLYAVQFLYFSTEILFGNSLGKRLLGLFILDEDGNDVTIISLLIRYFLKFSVNIFTFISILIINYNTAASSGCMLLSSVFGLVIGLGSLSIFGSNKQTIYDKFAGTAVYKISAQDSLNQAINSGITGRPQMRDPNSHLIFK